MSQLAGGSRAGNRAVCLREQECNSQSGGAASNRACVDRCNRLRSRLRERNPRSFANPSARSPSASTICCTCSQSSALSIVAASHRDQLDGHGIILTRNLSGDRYRVTLWRSSGKCISRSAISRAVNLAEHAQRRLNRRLAVPGAITDIVAARMLTRPRHRPVDQLRIDKGLLDDSRTTLCEG